ncbi:hypothetical protein BT63DRAFT_427225 [Microthyrium microscopicum]|uniref:Uncharacterized protein n=1 Tax=Microthyrium microscopicum TaxID=703497 RepID=A0A6A6U780_9PEZI|nr:hypothetical protein BT63DRAFT_427225 [Microthyrium microscopicum]
MPPSPPPPTTTTTASTTSHSPPSPSDTASRPKRQRSITDFNLHLPASDFKRIRVDTRPTSPPPSSRQLPSPLFFSSRSRTNLERPQLPPRFSSGEAGARVLMFSKAKEEESFKTVTLPRGFLTSGSRSASEKSLTNPLTSIKPENEQFNHAQLLSSLNFTEFLEQDLRPTFIINLNEHSDIGASALHIIFANAALRHSQTLLSALHSPNVDLRASFNEFLRWSLTPASTRDSSDITPKFSYAGASWFRSTLRAQVRVISADHSAASTVLSNAPTPGTPYIRRSSEGPRDISNLGRTSADLGATDYFGNAAPIPELSSKTVHQEDIGQKVRDVSIEAISSPTGIAEHTRGALPSVEEQAEVGFFDWTRLSVTDNLPRHIQLACSIDWGATALGPMKFWSADLRQMCNLIMASPHPAAMYWGPELVAIYNEAYIPLAGQKHPNLMGSRYQDAWHEIWDEVKGAFLNAQITGQATMKDDDRLFMNRSKYLEETYFSWCLIPMVGADGSVVGLYNPAFEKTSRKIAERRMLTLREVGERTACARDIKGFWTAVEKAIQLNEEDTPFALLYSANEDIDSDTSSVHSMSLIGTKQCTLEGALGVPLGHPCAPQQVDLKSGQEGFAPMFREALNGDGTVLLRVVDGPSALGSQSSRRGSRSSTNDPEDLADAATLEFPYSQLEGIEWRGFKDPCRSIVVCAVHATAGDSVLGFMVLGVNPRRPFDQDYNLFVQLLTRQLATSLASVVLFEEEIKRGAKAAKMAALDRIELSTQLAKRTEEAKAIETRFSHMAEFSPAGLFIADSQGRLAYCNSRWYEITDIPKDLSDNWIDYVHDSDREAVRLRWNKLIHDAEPANFEFRFKTKWIDVNGSESDTWVLLSAHPEKESDSEGALQSVFGNITNISTQKWAQGFQKKKMEEAVKLKSLQEEFIDITSHEMRNPLSAVLQCADEISSVLSEFNTPLDSDKSTINNCIDAAETIILCAQHQKRIVDDILTLSKLDSNMLFVTPVDVQPLVILQRALKMFESEINSAGIDMRLNVDESYNRMNIDWTKLDPQRVGQILINLMTNAIKFTSNINTRRGVIEVILRASTERPSKLSHPLVEYSAARSKPDHNLMHGPDWGDGEPLFIEYCVRDTGPGLTEAERLMLFNKFTQASHRTHVQYGGSGLGLFISRELSELQGGEIGVASESGVGSSFAFYVQTRRSTKPDNPELGIPANLKSLESKSRKAGKAVASSVPIKRPSLLVVEDNLVNQKVLRKQLENLGFPVTVANHGGEALDILQRSTFWRIPPGSSSPTKQYTTATNTTATDTMPQTDTPIPIAVVLMDWEMPVMGGIESTKAIRQWEAAGKLTGHVPIIGVTANARSEQIAALISAGMDDVVCKPFRVPELVPKIEELVGKFSAAADGASGAAGKT